MKRNSETKNSDDLQPRYDVSEFKNGVRGKYYKRATQGTNLVLIEPNLSALFPDSESVNRALRVLADAAQTVTAPKPRRKRA
jgi:hypothetical protein